MKWTTLIAILTGYYFGSQAGEKRYRQIVFLARTIANSQWFRNLMSSTVESVTGQRPDFRPASARGQ